MRRPWLGRGPAAQIDDPREQRIDDTTAILTANVEAALADLERPSILVTSALDGEGRTSLAARLAYSLAVAGQRVVLVDFDLRAPGIHQHLGIPNDIGVVDVLLGRHPADACLRFVSLQPGLNGASKGFYVMPAGKVEGEPRELIGGKRTRALLGALESQASVVIADGPSVLGKPDAATIGRLVGGAVLMVSPRRTPTSKAEQAKAELMRNQVRLLGVVLNNSRVGRKLNAI